MAQLIVRNLEPEIVAALKARAVRQGHSMEAEHRHILRTALRSGARPTNLKEWLRRMPNVGSDRDFSRRRHRARSVRV